MVIAEEILARAIDRYGECTSYSDTGFSQEPGEPNSRKEFKTYFVRPDRFRFEWSDYHPYFGEQGGAQHNLVWSSSEGTFAKYHFHSSVESTTELHLAVAGATGVSSGIIYRIYGMLYGLDGREHFLRGLEEVTLVGEESLENDRCHYLKAATQRRQYELWICQSQFALRKLREYVTITEDLQREAMETLKKRENALFATLNLEKRPIKARSYIRDCTYRDIKFDRGIDSGLFDPVPNYEWGMD